MKNTDAVSIAILVMVSLLNTNCSRKAEKVATLKDAYKDYFFVGAALTGNQILGFDAKPMEIVKEQFNTITSENALKWDSVHPEQDKFTFAQGDSFVSYGQKNNMFIIGHTLLWHQQTPKWTFVDLKGKQVGRDTLLKRLKDHIFKVAGRYKGKINGWDVVNEALEENGELRKTKWLEIIGEDYIEKAFQYAYEADSTAELYYNDYNIEQTVKRTGAIRIIKNLQSKGIKISGVGIQAHWHLGSPSIGVIDSAITDFATLGVKIMLTELDFNVLPNPWDHTGANVSDTFAYKKEMNPYAEGLPDSIQQKFTKRYTDLFAVLVKHKGEVSRVTFWGIYDGQSWLNGWPIAGRTNYPLIFDRNLQPKPAFDSIINIVAPK